MGLAMGATAVALIYSPWGRRSGAHLNPATTFTFWRLGHVDGRDAAPYAVAQVVGGALGVALAAVVLGQALADPRVHYVVTRPGPWGALPAFGAEALLTFVLMSVVLAMGCMPRLERWTGVAVGLLVWLYIAVEAPVSGMSLNPARTLASAVVARDFTAFWIYVLAPPLGMALAAEAHLKLARARGCAKLRHALPCHFCGREPGSPGAH
jgi:aquaporin Z